MKVYIDIIFIVNFLFDFILLLFTSIILKRNTKIIRILIGSLIGSISILILFIRFNTVELFLFKLIISIIMTISTFSFKNIRYFFINMIYLYLVSIIMGGVIYFFNNQFSSNIGLLFINNYSYNIILGIIICIIGIYFYYRNIKLLKRNYNKYLKARIVIEGVTYEVNAFLDTGNKLVDPYSFKPIILIDKNLVNNISNTLLVPYKTVSGDGLLECLKGDKIYIDGLEYKKKFLVGLSSSINIDGINCILNERILES